MAAILLVTPTPRPAAFSWPGIPGSSYGRIPQGRHRIACRTDTGIDSATQRPPIPLPLPLLLLLHLGKDPIEAEAPSNKAGFATPSLSSELKASHWSRIFKFQGLQLLHSGPPGMVGVGSELFSTPLGPCLHCCWPYCCCCCCLGWTASVASITTADGSSGAEESQIPRSERRDGFSITPGGSFKYAAIQPS
ncbi:uncharacterized protein LOC116803412 [Drosophila sechellia]|uniref:uncharacterized protein LOC116803412 n=1 Tax=Drosophila sechellia TaxID=7238 RepID=UPI0013DE7542|nr:uncharacterized protein LOC116803412 [Drosophila sechellia]